MKSGRRSTGVAAIAVALLGLTAILAADVAAQMLPRPAEGRTPKSLMQPPAPPISRRSIPFVSIRQTDGSWRDYETNAFPLINKDSCFGWRLWIGGPPRFVSMVEVQHAPGPMKQIIAGPETRIEGDNERTVTELRVFVSDGYLQRRWCVLDGDPAGVWRFDITVDGERKGEFSYCAIDVGQPPSEPIDPTKLSCPNRFHSVERRLPALGRG